MNSPDVMLSVYDNFKTGVMVIVRIALSVHINDSMRREDNAMVVRAYFSFGCIYPRKAASYRV